MCWVPGGGTEHHGYVTEAQPELPNPYSIHPQSVQRQHLAHPEGLAGRISSDGVDIDFREPHGHGEHGAVSAFPQTPGS